MFKLLLLFFLTVVIPVQSQSDDWFYDMGDDWEVSNTLKSVNPYYGWYKQAAKQMAMYGYAKHVGNINRGQYFNPELNMPANRAFGYQSDFNPQDFNSGAFMYKPQGQKYRAKAVHVNEGLASYVGEVRTMPIGQHVQEDGTILVQTPYKGDPCSPNPCTNVRMSACTVVNKFTAKCSRSKSYKLTLAWFDPLDATDVDLWLTPALHDGSKCDALNPGQPLQYASNQDCGALFSEEEFADHTEVHSTLTSLEDGTKYTDYTYAVIVDDDTSDYNLSEGGPILTVKYDGVVKQTLAAPRYRPGGANVNYDGRELYFFGCFRPQYGFVDTRGAGFYDKDDAVFAGLRTKDSGLCKALLNWPAPGFNPYVQTGSGGENGGVNHAPAQWYCSYFPKACT